MSPSPSALSRRVPLTVWFAGYLLFAIVCGGIAGDPIGAAVLSGLGVRELSVSIPAVAGIKAQLRRATMAENRDLARRALACTTAADVRGLK